MVFLDTKIDMPNDVFKKIIEEKSADIYIEQDEKEDLVKAYTESNIKENLARLLVDFKNLKDI